MTELEPILHTSSDELELGLLRSADGDEPSPAAFSKTAVALGLGGVALSAGGSAGAASGGAAGLASIWVAALKALAIGATSGLVVSAGAQAVLSEPHREETASVAFDSIPEKSQLAVQRAPAVPGGRVTAALPEDEI